MDQSNTSAAANQPVFKPMPVNMTNLAPGILPPWWLKIFAKGLLKSPLNFLPLDAILGQQQQQQQLAFPISFDAPIMPGGGELEENLLASSPIALESEQGNLTDGGDLEGARKELKFGINAILGSGKALGSPGIKNANF